MKISILTDAPKHNLAIMKISAWHKQNNDQVLLNMPIVKSDYTYASVLFGKNRKKFIADEYGGPAFKKSTLSFDVEKMKPDYELFNIDYSLGYTFRPCYNTCFFCKVPKMEHPDVEHHSIFEFHDYKFKKICLLNNNTFQDPRWKETFQEIWAAGLTVIDENGYDIRLLNDEKAAAIKKTKFQGQIHFAWDRMQDEALVVAGLRILRKHKIRGVFYILIGFDTTIKDDLYRCEVLRKYKQDPYIMPYVQNKVNKRFKRFVGTYMWRKYRTFTAAWDDYTR
ncbi:MAG TPA: hypothetical protein DD405_05055 [Desulfobacteraceae bacterium]|nr:hypothetical protein [Desulfobacteraceae bacterium]